ncbi:MAG: Ig-like domain repeat protein [Gemmataceae bacterium]|nr:Ig-like domain repeat protein [Gemmataceae bacterium]
MGSISWLRRLRTVLSSPGQRPRKASRRLRLEELETRVTPANTFTWSGLGPNTDWSTGSNWVGGSAPTGQASAFEDLVFPSGPTALTANNNLTVSGGLATFNSITFAGSNYNLTGNQIILGNPSGSGSGSIIVNSGALGETLALSIQMGGSSGGRQFVTVNAGTDLTISGQLSGSAGVELTKTGSGMLTLSGDNSAFNGPITLEVNSGVLRITDANALGSASARTTVDTNAQLQLNNVSGTINEDILLNGNPTTTQGTGSLLHLAGTTSWAGNIQMGTDTTLAILGGSLHISGQISDLSAPHHLTKTGSGTLILSNTNTYRGLTNITAGTVEIRVPTALGTADGTAATGTTVSSSATLQLNPSAAAGFTVQNELLTLNGAGSGLGSLYSLSGNNTWTADVLLAGNSTVGVAGATFLTITGAIRDISGPQNLTKADTGTLVLPRENFYRGTTTISAGTISIRDSRGLGAVTSGTTVADGATLLLQIDGSEDSETGTTNRLLLREPLTITGLGVGGVGALHSASGLNVYQADITLSGSNAAIGVDPEPNRSNSTNYFTRDFSLTITGDLVGTASNKLAKVGTGHLILPEANNRLTAPVEIVQGWITARDNNSLGATIPNVSQNIQPLVTINEGTALHLYPFGTGSLLLSQNFNVAGRGIDHPFALINQQGAIENLTNINELPGNIDLRGQVGFGVENVFGPGELYVTGFISEKETILNVAGNAAGGSQENINVIDTLATAGTVTIRADVFGISDSLRVYLGDYDNDPANAVLVYDSTTNGDFTNPNNQNRADITVTYTATDATATAVHTTGRLTGGGGGPGGGPPQGQMGQNWQLGPVVTTYAALTNTFISIVMNQGGSSQAITQWTYLASIVPVGVTTSGISKLGSELLIIQAEGTYTGLVDIEKGVILAQNDTALGAGTSASNVVNVRSGTALLLANKTPADGGGQPHGLQVWGTRLVLSGPGNTTLGRPLAPLTILTDNGLLKRSSEVIVPSDHLWRGPITLGTSSVLNIPGGTRLSVYGPIGDASNTAPAGSNLIMAGGGDLVLAGPNTYRGTTYVGTQTNPGNVNAFFNSANPQPLPGGVLTVAHSQGLGSPLGGTIVDNGSSLRLQGDLTIAGEPLTIQGTGVGTGATPQIQDWFNLGPQPVASGTSLGTAAAALAGRVTGIAVDPTDPLTMFISTAGGSAWLTTNGGLTWRPLFDVGGGGHLFAGAIAVAPTDRDVIYLGTGEANNSADSYVGFGVYKSTDGGSTWMLLLDPGLASPNPHAQKAVARILVDPTDPDLIYVATSSFATGAPAGTAASPAGVWRYDSNAADGSKWFNLTGLDATFPAHGAYSDLALASGTLYLALGTPTGSATNGVFRSTNFKTTTPTWNRGNFPARANAGRIQISASGSTVYAAVTNSSGGALLDIQKSTDGGATWTAMASPGNYLGSQGQYASAVLTSGSTVYVGGQNQISVSTDGGANWTNITVDAGGNGPQGFFHALAFDGAGHVIAGTDGGVWQLDPGNSNAWKSLNGRFLSISQVNSATVPSSSPVGAFAGLQVNGSAQFTGTTGWSATGTGTGGLVRTDPTNSSIVYAIQGGTLMRSTTGGSPGSYTSTIAAISFAIDPISANRLVANSGGTIRESFDQGSSWTSLGSFGQGAVAVAGYQGIFKADPGFPQVTDRGANNSATGTIYSAGGNSIIVTKDGGSTTQSRPLPGSPALGSIADIIVDPRDRDTVYVVRSTFDNQGRKVYRSTDAGRNWTDITGDLPDLPVWKIALDPRTDTLYIGTDNGVFRSTNGGANWVTVGTHLPHVQVRDLYLDQTLNTLTIATYGRGVYQLLLTQTDANAGALHIVGGSVIWTGPIQLAGPTLVRINGSQLLPNTASSGRLNILGTVSDLTAGGNHLLTKVGGGTLVLSGPNTYGGITDLQDGMIIANNPSALGGSRGRTIVHNGTVLALQADLAQETVALEGHGVPFNGHNTGSLRNLSNNNTFTGTLELHSDVTIGVDTGSSLTIGTKAGLLGTGTITDQGNNFDITKELTGSLILGSANTYGGSTAVEQGVLAVRHSGALGSGGTPANGTSVVDGSQLQIAGGITVATEQLLVSGSGIFGTGSVLNTAADNTWGGMVTFAYLPARSPATIPPNQVAVGVAAGTSLTIDAPVTQDTTDPDAPFHFGLTKVGNGKLVLKQANTYGGLTDVVEGVLNIQHGSALGSTGAFTPPSLIHDYQLNGSLADALGGPPLVETGGTLNPTNYSFSPDKGLTLSGALSSNDTYSIEMVFNLATVTGRRAIIGFKDRSANEGLYVLDTALNFFDVATGPSGVLLPGVNVHLVLTRDGATGEVVAYLNGARQFSFIDSGNLATFTGSGNIIHFFIDDTVLGGETSAGEVDYIRIHDAPLSAGHVRDLFNGRTSTDTMVHNGAALELEHAAGITSSEALTINGAGITPANAGVLRNVSGSNTWGGTVTLPSAVTVGVAASSQLTVSGTIQDTTPAAAVPAPSLTKVGTGTLVFPNANTYTGATLVNAGVLNVRHAGALGAVVSEQQTVTLGGPLTGTFRLTFNGQNTPFLPATATADDVETELNKLSSITTGGGSVSVTLTGSTFTITFDGGPLAGINQNQIGGNGTAGTTVATATARDGSFGTTVASGAALQLQDGISVTTERLTLNGTGISNSGALVNVSGDNTWASPITLASNSAIGVTGASDKLTLSGPIGDNNPGFGVTKLGPGTLEYAGGTGTANTYRGLTQVNVGTLLLNKTGVTALTGNLTIGDTQTGNALVRWLGIDQVANTATVIVNSDGTLDLGGQTDTIGPLQIVRGQATTGSTGSGALTVGSLTMTAGTFTAATATSQLILGGNVTANSDSTGKALITGSGSLALGNATRTFTVNNGPEATDLLIEVPITGTGTAGLTKSGPGRLELDKVNTYSGTTRINAGDVQVDGTIGSVALDGGTLSGSGTVGRIAGVTPPASSAAAGTVNPGDNSATPSTGILRSADVVWGADTTFFVELNDTTPGTQHDQLLATGNVTLGGATLTGSVGSGVVLGDRFTIIETSGGTISGKFAEPFSPSTIFIGGQKFVVDYSDNTRVVLERAKNNVTLDMDANDNPSRFGQPVTFTVTIISEPGAGPVSTSTTVTFDFFFNPATGSPTLLESRTVNVAAGSGGSRIATFAPTVQPLAVGSYSLVVTFSGDDAFNSNTNSASPFVQQVIRAATSVGLSRNPTPSVYGQPVTVTAAISVTPPGAGLPTGSLTFKVDGNDVPTSPGNVDATGKASVVFTTLGAGSHIVAASYGGDGSFEPSNSANFTLVIDKANTSVAVAAAPSATVFGQPVTFTATVSAVPPGAGLPTGPVTFYDGPSTTGRNLGTLNLDGNGTASLQVSSLTAAIHTITVAYSGDSNFLTNEGTRSHTASQAPTTTTVEASFNPSVFSQPITYTATVTADSPSQAGSGGLHPPLAGSVTFVIDGTPRAPQTLDSSGKASILLSNLDAGPHTVVANYGGTSNFVASSDTHNQTVNPAGTTTTLTSSQNPSALGLTVTFSVTVSPVDPAVATPVGSVTFVVDGTPQTPVALDSAGKASLVLDALATGQHAIVANYTGHPNFLASSDALTQTVISTTTVVSASANPSAFGEPVTFTATINPSSPIAGPPVGTVTFVVDGVSRAPLTLDSSGQARLTVPGFTLGTHTVSATYGGTLTFGGSSGSLTQTVNRADTSITIDSSSNPSTFGQVVTFTATVAPLSPSLATPGGSVTFVVDGVRQAPLALDGSGQASIRLSRLAAGPHTVGVSYNGETNFVPGTRPASLTQTVNPLPDVTVPRDSGPVSIPGYAPDVASGIPELPGQPLQYAVSNDNPDLFVTQPSISPDGTLSLQLSEARGSAVVTVRVVNSAGQDVGPAQTFTLIAQGIDFASTPLEVFVYQVYFDLLGRKPDPEGMAFWTQSLEQGLSRSEMVRQVTSSAEYRIALIGDLYRRYLGREADPAGRNSWLRFLGAGNSVDQMKAIMLGSREFMVRNGGSDPWLFLNAVYQAVLRRGLDDAGAAFFGTLLQRVGPAETALAILRSSEADAALVNEFFLKYLGRPAGASGVRFWVPALQAGTSDQELLANVLGSPEYFGQPSTSHDLDREARWLAQVYLDLLGRELDEAGRALWVGLLSQGATHRDIVRQILDSAEYRARVVDAVARDLLGRPADPGLINFGLGVLANGTVDQLKAQLMGSAEYFFARGQGSDGGFLDAAFLDGLDRRIDSGGLAYWSGQLAQGATRAEVALGILDSPEADGQVVQDRFRTLLLRDADGGSSAFWTGVLQQGTREAEFTAALLSSAEYLGRFAAR